MLYSVSDGDVAKVENNKLYGVNEGTTKLTLSTKEFGGYVSGNKVGTPEILFARIDTTKEN